MSIKSLVLQIFEFYASVGDIVYEFFAEYSRTILDYIHIGFDSVFYLLLYITIFVTLVYAGTALYLLFTKRKQTEIEVSDEDLPTVTVQIPTYNELAALNCARRCLKFDYPKEKYEIIIGDDSSDGEVSKKIDAFAEKHNVKVTRRGSNEGYKPGNLNHMLKFTEGDIIVIFDSDFLPEPDFLRRIVAPFVYDDSVSAVQSRWVTRNLSQSLTSVMGGMIPMITHHLSLPFLTRIGANRFIAGSAEAVKKETLHELGGWRSGALTEDIEFSLQLTNAGKKIIYLENLHCECEAPFTLKDLCKQQLRWSYGVIMAIKKNGKNILFNDELPIIDKSNMFLLLAGYLMTLLFFLLGLTGTMSIITHRPEAIDIAKFLSETSLNFVLTSGYTIASVVTLLLADHAKEIPRVVVASVTVGIALIAVVTLGIFKALFNREMEWMMLEKKGNYVVD